LLAIVAHEIPRNLPISILLHSGFSKKKALLLNFLSSLATVAGPPGYFTLAGRPRFPAPRDRGEHDLHLADLILGLHKRAALARP
jgi:zinc and cadmium transporter